MPWVGLPYVIVVFPGHTHLQFASNAQKCIYGEITAAYWMLGAIGEVGANISLQLFHREHSWLK